MITAMFTLFRNSIN